MTQNCKIAFSTTDSKDEAVKIANALVGENLAACVNIVPGLRSIYRWQGKVRDEEEFLMIIKTTGKNADAIKARLKELHHYEVPELIFLPIEDGLDGYLKWIGDNSMGERG